MNNFPKMDFNMEDKKLFYSYNEVRDQCSASYWSGAIMASVGWLVVDAFSYWFLYVY